MEHSVQKHVQSYAAITAVARYQVAAVLTISLVLTVVKNVRVMNVQITRSVMKMVTVSWWNPLLLWVSEDCLTFRI